MRMASRFLERLEQGPIVVGDGGMGALISAAVPRLRCPEEANLRAPEAVVSLHVSFINAGADLIETNSFGANRRKLAGHFLEDQLEEINSTAVKLARQARETTGKDVFVAGSIGPLGQAATARVRKELFAEQASVLEGRGADLFMVETFYDLEEVADAVEAVRSVSSLPIVALMTFAPMVVNAYKGLSSVDRHALDLMDSLASSHWQIFLKLRLPSSLPYVFGALKVGITLALIGAVVSEFFNAQRGLGITLSNNIQVARMPLAWSAIVAAAILGLILYGLVSLAERAAIPWHVSFRRSR